MDTAQGRPGDALEYTAGRGRGGFHRRTGTRRLSSISRPRYSYVTDTPDFWRRPDANYPQHGQRFTGEPAYFRHVTARRSELMEALGRTPSDYRYAVLHQPNTKFPQRAAEMLGFRPSKLAPGCLSRRSATPTPARRSSA